MDLFQEIRSLEEKGVFIHSGWEHYKDGSNLCFSIEFRLEEHKDTDKRYQTGWYNDNHEFGDGADTMACAVKMAKWFLKDTTRLDHYFDPRGMGSEEYRENRSIFNAFLDTIIINPIPPLTDL